MNKQGKVYLVGAGPGDLRLMTLKGKDCLQKADVVLYDRLVNPLFLEWTKPEAELIYCGKLPDRHLLRQEAINELLIEKGRQGKVVVRLKGGDPSVFGRVGEEADVLKEAGLPYEIVPGITAGIGASTYAGVPVTHRDYGASFTVVTGHDKSPSGQPLIDWHALANGIDTIAFYMGVSNLPYITEQLIAHGRDPETCVLLIQWGTIGKQRVVEGRLNTIVSRVKEEGITNPAITLVGNIGKLRTEKSWFESQRLFGHQVLIGRTTAEEGGLAKTLMEAGAEVFEFPRWHVTSKPWGVTPNEVQEADHLVFTSPHSVHFFFESLTEQSIDIRHIRGSFFAASKKSLKIIRSFACTAALLQELPAGGKTIIFGDEENEMKRKYSFEGASYVSTHQKALVPQSLRTCRRLLDEGRIETLVFPSAASVNAVIDGLEQCGESVGTLSQAKTVITFGPESSKAAKEAGFQVDIQLEAPSAQLLIETLEAVRV
ncbi:uroporphyrinogen-III C-methyltransferase [Halalkalibacterium halodurans]|uniref:uroporphyrinogen-III C-methyltransferase n=1 Tax=Halalkalibacterium halodurans TaxID=86665 RepID=UPI0010FD58CC|nr:uroporphyrinogen-III C-methyltransferase [Halalkalibacterium halodurans]